MARLAIAAIAVFLLTTVLLLGVRPLIAHDEARYAAIPAEMISSGDWTQLRLSGFRYYEKPPLGYWLTAASMSLLGPTAFAVRLPCAIAGGIAALAAWWVAVRITGRRSDGPLAFLVQVTTIGPAVLATLALLDPPFAACIAVTLAAFWSACTSRGRERAGWLAVHALDDRAPLVAGVREDPRHLQHPHPLDEEDEQHQAGQDKAEEEIEPRLQGAPVGGQDVHRRPHPRNAL
jgi:4-amino-4-deoxy-L-arabinose transferase-like glycosyltransferase